MKTKSSVKVASTKVVEPIVTKIAVKITAIRPSHGCDGMIVEYEDALGFGSFYVSSSMWKFSYKDLTYGDYLTKYIGGDNVLVGVENVIDGVTSYEEDGVRKLHRRTGSILKYMYLTSNVTSKYDTLCKIADDCGLKGIDKATFIAKQMGV